MIYVLMASSVVRDVDEGDVLLKVPRSFFLFSPPFFSSLQHVLFSVAGSTCDMENISHPGFIN